MKKTLYILLLISSFSVFSQETKSTVANNELSKINIYPNPFNNKTTITFYSLADDNINFIVQDLLGNIVFSDLIITTKGKNSIPFYRNKLIAGIYIYTLKSKNKVSSKRFVIK